ncbi:MAG: SDR family NAD(P)-dependent oxidoreductase [Candidatus Aenigmatarchaeota archaeon]
MGFWKGKKVLVTGGAGFIGSHLVDRLVALGANVTVIDDLSRGKLENLATSFSKIKFIQADLSKETSQVYFANQEFVFHLASIVGGVKKMSTKQTISAIIPTIDRNVYEACVKYEIKKVLYTSTACVYPVFLQTKEYEDYFLKEEDVFAQGAKPESIYGWSKLYGEILGRRYYEEFGLNVAIVREFNVYGEREDFDPETSHCIPALVRRALRRENPFVVWGTGEQSRSFLYVTDAVEGMILTMEKISDATPINLGAEERIKIKDLALKILQISGYNAKPMFDHSAPMGVFTRAPDITRAKIILHWKPKINLNEGIKRVIEWYKQRLFHE